MRGNRLMTEIISIINQKGGIGKTTTAQALGAGLRLKGFKVLSIDLDPQSNLSLTMGAETAKTGAYSLLIGGKPVREVIVSTQQGDLIPSGYLLATAELKIKQSDKLKEAIRPIKKNYDYIIIDCPPALGILTVNALTASDSVIIPAQTDFFALQGIGNLYLSIQAVKDGTNKSLKIKGILITKYNPRTILNRDLLQQLEDFAKKAKIRIFESKIRESIIIKEAQALRRDIFSYNPRAAVTQDYKNFIDEALNG